MSNSYFIKQLQWATVLLGSCAGLGISEGLRGMWVLLQWHVGHVSRVKPGAGLRAEEAEEHAMVSMKSGGVVQKKPKSRPGKWTGQKNHELKPSLMLPISFKISIYVCHSSQTQNICRLRKKIQSNSKGSSKLLDDKLQICPQSRWTLSKCLTEIWKTKASIRETTQVSFPFVPFPLQDESCSDQRKLGDLKGLEPKPSFSQGSDVEQSFPYASFSTESDRWCIWLQKIHFNLVLQEMEMVRGFFLALVWYLFSTKAPLNIRRPHICMQVCYICSIWCQSPP